MGGGKYKPQEYIVGDDPYTTQESPLTEKDLGEYTNVPQEIIDKEDSSTTPLDAPKSTTTTKGAARGLQL